jgi:hypothetical protein
VQAEGAFVVFIEGGGGDAQQAKGKVVVLHAGATIRRKPTIAAMYGTLRVIGV